ncbi:MAG: hypothetical protein IJH12_08660 [Clostridia bacterium]|nr:hypothetical protein [Clostridia bacterium]
MYVISLIQTCNKEDFSKYESIISENISSSIEHTLDTSENKIELVDETLGRMILTIDEEDFNSKCEKISWTLNG